MKNNKNKKSKIEKVEEVKPVVTPVVEAKTPIKPITKVTEKTKPVTTKKVEILVKMEQEVAKDLIETSKLIKVPFYKRWFQKLRNLLRTK